MTPDPDIDVQHFLALNERLCELVYNIASGNYDDSSVDALYELTRASVYPRQITQLAESFGLMLVRLQARELHAQTLIRDLERARTALQEYTHHLEQRVEEKTNDLRIANEELTRLSLMDGLTGIANRRHFDRYLESEWNRSIRKHAPLSLILIDVDHFKRYNDALGHLQGDESLCLLARTICGCTRRSSDLVARYGGEEFAAILPETDITGAVYCAETMREAVENLGVSHPDSTTGPVMTISLGVARAYPVRQESAATLIARADHCLYQAKSGGRNRVVAHAGMNTISD